MKKKLLIGGGLIIATLLLSYFIIVLVAGESEDSDPSGNSSAQTSLTPAEFNNVIELSCLHPDQASEPEMGHQTVESNAISIPQAVICLAVRNQQPVSPLTVLSADNGPVFCWVDVLNGAGRKIRYIWYLEGKAYPSQWIKVDHDRFQTWCKKNINCKSSGSGVVEIVDETGRVLKTVDFNIVKASRQISRSGSPL